MKNIKQIAYTGVAGMLAFAPLMVGAATTSGGSATLESNGFNVGKTENNTVGLGNESIFALITTFMNWLLGLVGALAVIAFVISGILYLTAAGDEDRVEKAKSVMLYAIIGLVVALIGLIIVNAVSGLMGNTTGKQF